MTVHTYSATLSWSGTTGVGYRAYDRAHTASFTPQSGLVLSADAAFRGDGSLPNPEQLLVAAASSCQLLSFLGAAAREGIDVLEYTDRSYGNMPDDAAPVSITEIELRPVIRVRGADPARVTELVAEAHDRCYIANSLRGEVRVIATIEVVS